MKQTLKIIACLLLSVVFVLLTISLLPEVAAAKPSVPTAFSEPETQFITYTIYLPILYKAESMAYGLEVDLSNYAANITDVQTLGFSWIRLQMPWKDVETADDNFNWGNWDEQINAYHAAGIKILLTIDAAPDWARPFNDDRTVNGLPDDPQTYVDFVTAVLTRYDGQINAVEIWKEQNLYYAVGGQGRVDVTKYMPLLKATYTAIKTQHPDIVVVSGALTPTGAPPPAAIDDREYLGQMYVLGLKEYSDAIGAQPWGFANPPDALFTGGDYDPNRGYDDHRSFFFRNTMEDYRQIMVSFGDGEKKIWATEFGWPVWRYEGDIRFVFAQENTLAEQAQYTQRAYEMGKEWGWVGAMFLWNLDYAVTMTDTASANFSILTVDGTTPAYDALKDMPK